VLAEYRYPIIKGEQCRALPFNYKSNNAVPEKSKHKQEQPFTVFVKNCPKEWTHEDLYGHFKQYGKVLSAKMSIDANFTTRGYAFVTFDSAKVGQKAIQQSNGLSHSGLCENADAEQKLAVSEYLLKQDRLGSTAQKCSTNLYVKNFPAKEAGEFAEDDLRALFEEFGEIASVAIMRDDSNKSKGFGFICFKE
jgi:polyadenylate-binding protein